MSISGKEALEIFKFINDYIRFDDDVVNNFNSKFTDEGKLRGRGVSYITPLSVLLHHLKLFDSTEYLEPYIEQARKNNTLNNFFLGIYLLINGNPDLEGTEQTDSYTSFKHNPDIKSCYFNFFTLHHDDKNIEPEHIFQMAIQLRRLASYSFYFNETNILTALDTVFNEVNDKKENQHYDSEELYDHIYTKLFHVIDFENDNDSSPDTPRTPRGI